MADVTKSQEPGSAPLSGIRQATPPKAPQPARSRARTRGAILRLVVLLALAVGCVELGRQIDLHALGQAFSRARLPLLFPAALLALVNLLVKAIAWHVMLAPGASVGVRPLFRYTINAYATSVVTPARAGEALRIWQLKSEHAVPVSASTGVALTEHVLDGLCLLLITLPIPWLIPTLPGWASRGIAITAMVVATAFAVAVSLAYWTRSRRFVGWRGHVAQGMAVFSRPKRLLAAGAIVLCAWGIELVLVRFTLTAMGLDLVFAAPALILLLVNLALIVPSTPAQVGAFELGVIAALKVLGVPTSNAAAFALLYHAIQIVPLLLLALVNIRSLPMFGGGRGRKGRRSAAGGQASEGNPVSKPEP